MHSSIQGFKELYTDHLTYSCLIKSSQEAKANFVVNLRHVLSTLTKGKRGSWSMAEKHMVIASLFWAMASEWQVRCEPQSAAAGRGKLVSHILGV